MASCNGFKNWTPKKNQTCYPLAGAELSRDEEVWILELKLRDLRILRRACEQPENLTDKELKSWSEGKDIVDSENDADFFVKSKQMTRREQLELLITEERNKIEKNRLSQKKKLGGLLQERKEEKER